MKIEFIEEKEPGFEPYYYTLINGEKKFGATFDKGLAYQKYLLAILYKGNMERSITVIEKTEI